MTSNDPITVIVDSDAIIAQGNLGDSHHSQAVAISKRLVEIGAKVIYPSVVIIEATTLMHRYRPKEGEEDITEKMRHLAAATLEVMADPLIIIAPIDQRVIAGALKYYDPGAGRNHTTFDCAVAAIADTYNTKYIFSWDEFYTKKGFKLAEELLRESVLETKKPVVKHAA